MLPYQWFWFGYSSKGFYFETDSQRPDAALLKIDHVAQTQVLYGISLAL